LHSAGIDRAVKRLMPAAAISIGSTGECSCRGTHAHRRVEANHHVCHVHINGILASLEVIEETAGGLADTKHDLNRLTIIIGEDGRIADAAWE
jgi:hypothetical protein